MHELKEQFREASWARRIAILLFGVAIVSGSLYAIRTWGIPHFQYAYSVLVQITISYAFLTFMAFLFSPSTGKKMANLGIAVFERLLVDPLLMLFRAGTKKKDTR